MVAINIREIARLANVSVATVSRVLNTPELVQIDTRERVLQTIQRTGYAPRRNGAARDSAPRVLLFLLDLMDYGFYEPVAAGLETVAQPRGYAAMFCPISAAAERRAAQLDALLRQRPAGAIWALRDFYPEEAARFTAAGVPLVLARRYDGAPAGYGTHEELLSSSQVYQEICASQSAGKSKGKKATANA